MLNAKVVGDGPPLLILHGLFGSLDNWQTLARRFGESRTCHLLDLRNHGKSPHYDAHGYEEMAADVVTYLDARGTDAVAVMGHSMGGKAAMRLALDYPERVSQLIVVDMAPRAYVRGHDEIFAAMRRLPLTQNLSRAELDAHLSEEISEPGIRQFLLKNLRRTPEGYAWKLNLGVIERDYPRILEAVSGEPYEGPTLFIRGGKSGYVREADWPEISTLFPRAELVTVAGAGHWVHAEAPAVLAKEVEMWLGGSS